MKHLRPFLFCLWMLFFSAAAFAEADHPDEKNHAHTDEHEHENQRNDEHKHDDKHEHDHGDDAITHINTHVAQQVGIKTAVVAAITLHQSITTYGTLTAGPEQLSHVRARFAGLIKTVTATIGDDVKAGDLLAEVESNESLKTYQVRAPISGLIVQRHANTGEFTQDQILFSVANYAKLWAELRIYPEQQNNIVKKQSVKVLANNLILEGVIDHIIPATDKPYLMARVKINNPNKALAPGLFIEAHINTTSVSVPLAVRKDAVQMLEGRNGVFVKHDDKYEFTPLVLGRNDDEFYEVLSGLDHTAEYVSQNSYLLKADIEKSEAEHQH